MPEYAPMLEGNYYALEFSYPTETLKIMMS